MKINFLTLVIILNLSACNKIYYYPDKDLGKVKTVVLAHTAGGNYPFKKYSMNEIKYTLSIMEGIEVDVQLSANSTVWLGHDSDLPSCGSNKEKCFRVTTDAEIVQLDSCLGQGTDFTRLEDVFKYMSENYPYKYISIDVKAMNPCNLSDLNVLNDMNIIADGIIKLKYKYKLIYVMVESQTATFLKYIKDNGFGIECYLTTWGDFERGMLITLKKKLHGISFKYKFKELITADHVYLLHKKGIKIQLWVVNTPSDIEEAISLNPDFIQTDNIEYFYNSQ